MVDNAWPFKFAFSANAFNRFSVPDAIAAVAEAGYEGIELMFDEPHLLPEQVDEGVRSEVRTALVTNRIEASNANAFTMRLAPGGDTWRPSWIESDMKRRRLRIEHTKASLDLAARLGARSISTEPGGPVPKGMDRDEALRLFLAGIAEVAPVAEERRVLLLVEPEPGLLIETSDQFLEFIRHVSSPMVACNFDVGHFYCVGEDPTVAFRKLLPFVRHVHLEDIAKTRKHKHLVPGTGAIDIPAMLRALAKVEYSGWVTVELYPYQDDPAAVARQAMEYLQGIAPA